MTNSKRFLIITASGLALLLLFGLVVMAQGPGGGMMGQGNPMGQGFTSTVHSGMMGGGYGQNMGGYGQGGGMMGGGYGQEMGMGGGMMGGINPNNAFYTVKPLLITESVEAFNTYLTNLGNPNLMLDEVMLFDNQAYAIIMEKDTNIGAMELLLDPTTKAIYPEMGPNMMWNLKYGMNSGYGYNASAAPMTITPDKALELARTYLTSYYSYLATEDKVDTFYGYYTMDVKRDGETVGMLSVNGYTGAVFPHTWHGKFLGMNK